MVRSTPILLSLLTSLKLLVQLSLKVNCNDEVWTLIHPHLLGRKHALTRLITWTLNSQVWADLINVLLHSNIVPT